MGAAMPMRAHGPRRRSHALIVLLAAACLSAPAGADLALWRALDWFQGSWRGDEKSMIGEGVGTRCATRLFGGRFHFTRSRTEISPEGNRPGGVWERWQIIARHPDTGRITLDQFDSSGYRRLFELDAAASRPDRYVFVASDPASAAEREGRLTLQVRRGERFEERLELGMAGEPLRVVSTHRWSRIGNDPGDCVHTPPELPGWFAPAN